MEAQHEVLEALHAAWPLLSADERHVEFLNLKEEQGMELFPILDPIDQAELLRRMDAGQRSKLLALLAPDDLTDVFQVLEEASRGDVFRSLSTEDMAEVQELARYDEDDAGGLMTPDFAHVLPGMNADSAILALRAQLRERPETLRYVYVLEKDATLGGVVSFRELFGARPGETVRSLMETDVVNVREDTDQEEVASLMQLHGFSALPVVDPRGRMKGIVTSDDIMHVMEEEATEDIHKLAAVAPAEEEYGRARVFHLWRRRVGWLSILLVTGFLTSTIMAHYGTTIQTAVVLAFFVPVIIGAGGNTGTQSAMMIVRGLSTGEIRARNWVAILGKELLVGLLLGIPLAAVLGVGGYFLSGGDGVVGAILATTMVAVVVWANLAGAILPVVVLGLKLDPAVVSAPLVATLVDASGLLIYFSIARTFLG